MIRSIILLSAFLFLPQNLYAFGSYCAADAEAYAQKYGGNNVALYYERVNGWGVNTYGSVAYTYNVGNKECLVIYSVTGTYFYGALCSEQVSIFAKSWNPVCGRIGTWTNQKPSVAVNHSA